MKAVLVSEFGGPEQLRLGQVADPVAGPGQVRVAVHAAGVNPVDAGNRADGGWAGLRVPCILGYDIAGVIDSVGPGVTSVAPGDWVMAMTHFPDGAGGYAEFAVLDAALVAPIGPATSFADAAAAGIITIGVGRPAMHARMSDLGAAACIDYAGEDDRRALRPVVSHVLPLAAAAEAHRMVEGGHAGGKIVLDVTSG